MKTKLTKQTACSGNTLLITLFITAIIGIVLASYLTLVRNQNSMTMRSQAWNSAITVIESGIEEALTHLDRHGVTNLLTDNWTFVNDKYTMTRWINDSYYVVTISTELNPSIVSQGYVPLPAYASVNHNSFFATAGAYDVDAAHFVNRAVRVTTRRNGTFAKAMVAKHRINMNGNNIDTDSFDSYSALYSNNGQYDVTRRRDNGDVASNDTITNTISFGNANIRGHASTGPKGSVTVGVNGSVGSSTWVSDGNQGIQPGYFTDDMNVDFREVLPPFTGGAFTPGNGSVNGTNYSYVVGDGNWQMSNLNMNGSEKKNMIVTGNAVLYVTGNVSLSGNASITIAPGGSLKLYVAGSADFSGNGIVNQAGRAENFMYFGLPSNTSVTITGNGTFMGTIYAPSAALNLRGSGNGPEDFIGASVSDTVTMNGHFKFHYDESLVGYDGGGKFIVTSWNEI